MLLVLASACRTDDLPRPNLPGRDAGATSATEGPCPPADTAFAPDVRFAPE